MEVRSVAVVCAVCIGAVVAGVTGQQPEPQVVPLEVILERAALSLEDFVTAFSNVVAEEKYVQNSSANLPSFSPFVSRRGSVASGPTPSRIRHREMKSDFLLVKTDELREWVPFRDVFEVDGVPVRDREERLTRLLLQPSNDALAQAGRIQDEGARYNIGNMQSTLNNPLLGQAVLQRRVQPRFRFSLSKVDKSTGVWVVEFKEQSSPTLVRGAAGRDLFSEGHLWIEGASGRVLKTELMVGQSELRASVTTSFRFDERFGINVPYEMSEQYVLANGSRIYGEAKYGRFRRFNVQVEDKLWLDPR